MVDEDSPEDTLLLAVEAAAANEFGMVHLTEAQQRLGVTRQLAFMAALVLQAGKSSPPFGKEQVRPPQPGICAQRNASETHASGSFRCVAL